MTEVPGGPAGPESVAFDVRTAWMYSDDDRCICCPGRHAFSRGGDVVRSDVPTRYEHLNDTTSHLSRAIEHFGDGADLEVVVRRRGRDLTIPENLSPIPSQGDVVSRWTADEDPRYTGDPTFDRALFVEKAKSMLDQWDGCLLCPKPAPRGRVGRRWICPDCGRRWYMNEHRDWAVARGEDWPLSKPEPWWRRLGL